ncbi:MAG: c-type cytochrome, partial [Planctomycetales bacterium]|nr:c-type cytochrome [Planctomycetales bacterium]
RDTDGDGRADESKVFCEVDAPRGLVWDHDRLYLMHPPNLSAFIDHDGDGVADEQKTLVKNLAFGYDKRPADHTTNGVSMGVDGWLYIAGGDFGFIDAEGTDGRKLTHRGGGVIRVRPDGTGLEIYSTGTRNILEVAISPTMDLFARDNTNDGGGWDVRLHHFTGMDDHGYPRLYKNFNDECVQPLADYGGGSGCGATYIDEPGMGNWNNAPFTADWGTGSLYRHSVQPSGATFKETSPPQSFIKVTRPTDADVDGNSRVYCASWRGATFNWAGPNVGYIVCVRPVDFRPDPMPDFQNATDRELIGLLDSPSYRRRLAAQRELVRRGNPAQRLLLDRGVAQRNDSRNLVEHLQSTATDQECIDALGHSDALVVHTAVRVLADRKASDACLQAIESEQLAAPALRALAMMHQVDVVDGLIDHLPSAKSNLRPRILAALCRLCNQEGRWNGDSWGTRPDTRGPYYQPERWSESERIASVLESSLDAATPVEAAELIQVMYRNRIQSSDALDRIIRLAASNEQLLGTAVAQLAAARDIARDIPPSGVDLLLGAASKHDAPSTVLADAVRALASQNIAQAPGAMVTALATLQSRPDAGDPQNQARQSFINSRELETFLADYVEIASVDDSNRGLWADVALLTVASRPQASPEVVATAKQTVNKAWRIANRRLRLMQAAVLGNNHYLDGEILAAGKDRDESIAEAAKFAINRLNIQSALTDDSPKINTLSTEDAAAMVVATKGDVVLGRQIFGKANCAACHTVDQNEVQKGPFLGNIAKTYKRAELAVAVLEPSKTIAQGFITNSILTTDGQILTGFVTAELSDQVTIRDQQGKEHTIQKADIDARTTSPTSIMPVGVMNEYSTYELASLLDYLQSLVP